LKYVLGLLIIRKFPSLTRHQAVVCVLSAGQRATHVARHSVHTPELVVETHDATILHNL